jgi:hypothetical protein
MSYDETTAALVRENAELKARLAACKRVVETANEVPALLTPREESMWKMGFSECAEHIRAAVATAQGECDA